MMRKSLLVLLAVSCTAMALPQRQLLGGKTGTSCESASAQDTCDSNDACTWCNSAAVKSKCYSKEDAKSLPPGVFECDAGLSSWPNNSSDAPLDCGTSDGLKMDLVNPTSLKVKVKTCDTVMCQGNPAKPDAYVACGGPNDRVMGDTTRTIVFPKNTTYIVFSNGVGVKEFHYPVDPAGWPSSYRINIPYEVENVFSEIKTPIVKVSDSTCESVSDEPSCDKDSTCTWCKSSAVKSRCYAKTDAVNLPSAIFACDAGASALPVKSTVSKKVSIYKVGYPLKESCGEEIDVEASDLNPHYFFPIHLGGFKVGECKDAGFPSFEKNMTVAMHPVPGISHNLTFQIWDKAA